jgi:hypothetical protein
MAVWIDYFDGYQVHIHEIRDLDDRVLVDGKMTGQAKGTGVPIRQPLGWVCSDFRRGPIGGLHFFLTSDETLKAAGLSE